MADTATARETLFALREQIARLEGKTLPAMAAAEREDFAAQSQVKTEKVAQARLSFDIPVLDEALDGGLRLDSLTEIRSRTLYDAGTASGFILSLVAFMKSQKFSTEPVLWIADGFSAGEAGIPYAGGIRQIGIDPNLVFHASPRRLDDALWLAEAALASRAFAATILEIHGNPKPFGLTESRRLKLRAKAAGRPLLLLRHAGDEEASSASFRMLVEPAPALERRLADGTMLGGSIGHPVFRITLEKSRNPAPLTLFLEWNLHDRQFHLARGTKRPQFRQRTTHSGAVFSASADRQDRPQALGDVVALERAS
jgi:protein ImuA